MTFTIMVHSIPRAEGQVTIYAPSGYGASLLSLATGNIWYWRQQRDHKTEEIKVMLLLLFTHTVEHKMGETLCYSVVARRMSNDCSLRYLI